MTALRWYGQERAPELASSAQAGYAIKHLVEHFGSKMMVAGLTPVVLKKYETERDVARGTVRRELAVLQAAISHAVKEQRLKWAPKLTLPAPGKSRTRHLSEDEIAKLIAGCKEPHVRLFVILALNTGARKGALLELRWTQVQAKLIYLNPDERDQTTKGRAVVPINDAIAAILQDARLSPQRALNAATEAVKRTNPGTLARRRADQALAIAERAVASPFVIQHRGNAVEDIKTGFIAACKRAGLAGVSPHTLRHTAGTIMARGGIDMFLIGKMLGQTIARTTELYAHHHPDWLQGASNALDRATTLRPQMQPQKNERV